MLVKEVTQKEKLLFNKLTSHPLQSWEWGDFRQKAGNGVKRLGVYKNGELKQAIQLIFHPVPIIDKKICTFIKGRNLSVDILKVLRKLANDENVLFVKMEPNIVVKKVQLPTGEILEEQTKVKRDLIEILKSYGAIKGRTLFTPTSYWIGLSVDEESLLKGFHSKARYNIGLAKRKGVKVVEDNSSKAFENYLELTRETVNRQRFYAHKENYHRLMWQTLNEEMIDQKKEPIARLLTAKYRGVTISAWVLFVFNNTLYYPYGASSSRYRNVMANNLMMWEAIRYGKKLGLKTFDLWGREPGKGFTRFKEAYNPSLVEFLGTWDLITNPLYYPYRIAEYVRWFILRFKNKLPFSKQTF
jgi:lipid II:glycine glycyltransferase (peptidoglycan interpeptide bridge formation enzyme)